MGKFHEQLAGLRAKAGLTMSDMAIVLGLKSASAYAYYENPNGYRGLGWPTRLLANLARAQAAGRIKISDEDLAAVAADESFAVHTAVQDAENVGAQMILGMSIQADGEDESMPATWKAESPVFIDAELLANLTEADREELIALRLTDPKLFPNSTPHDFMIIDRSVSEVAEPGLYVMHIRRSLELLQAERRGNQWILHPVSRVHDLEANIEVPEGRYVPVFGQVIWHGRSLVHSKIAEHSAFDPCPVCGGRHKKNTPHKKPDQKI